jgi:hypothetical protein
MLRIGDTGRAGKINHAIDINKDRWHALCGVKLVGWITTRSKAGGFVTGSANNCPRCEQALLHLRPEGRQ